MDVERYLVICQFGKNRSRYLAGLLTKKGYTVDFTGVGRDADEVQQKIDAATVLITVQPNIAERLRADYTLGEQRLIELDVDDRPEVVLPAGKPLDGDDWLAFQQTLVYPKLKEQLEEKLGESL